MRTGADVSKYVAERGGVERFSMCQRGEELLVFVEVRGEVLEVKESSVFQQALVAFLKEQDVPTEVQKFKRGQPIVWIPLKKPSFDLEKVPDEKN